MPQLLNSQKQVLLSDLKIADRMWSRMRGLLGTQSLAPHQGMYFPNCNSIHTFFMNYAIDCVFLDSHFKVKALKPVVNPGRLIWPAWSSRHVIEMPAGAIDRLGIKLGDQLHVGA